MRFRLSNPHTNWHGITAPIFGIAFAAFVAFTIEFDNEFERRTPHRTTRSRISSERGLPWRVSMVMWLKFMRHIPEQGGPCAGRLRRSDRRSRGRMAGAHGRETIGVVRESLQEVVSEPVIESSLYAGITPHRECWRAAIPWAEALQVVLHRGGYPDGS